MGLIYELFVLGTKRRPALKSQGHCAEDRSVEAERRAPPACHLISLQSCGRFWTREERLNLDIFVFIVLRILVSDRTVTLIYICLERSDWPARGYFNFPGKRLGEKRLEGRRRVPRED